MNERMSSNKRIGISLAIATAAVAGVLYLRSYKPHAEPPHRNDGKCEVEKGERDIASPTFDPESCGYCGDGIRQQWEQPSTIVDQAPTKAVCDVDFHCGNGKVDTDEAYAAVIPPRTQGGKYTSGVVRVTESCDRSSLNFCADDCNGCGGCVDAGHEDSGVRDAGQVDSGSAYCPDDVRGRLAPRIIGQLLNHASAARSAAGAPPDKIVNARVALRVSPPGVADVVSISLTCSDCKVGAMPPTTLSVAGIALPYVGEEC